MLAIGFVLAMPRHADAQVPASPVCAELGAELRMVCEALHDSLTRDDGQAFARWIPDAGFLLVSRLDGERRNTRVDRARLAATRSTPLRLTLLRPTDLGTARLLHQDLCDVCSEGPDCFGGCERSYFLRFHSQAVLVRLHFDRAGVTTLVVMPR